MEIAEGRQVEGVVGMQVTDDDPAQGERVNDGAQAADDAVSAVEQDRGGSGLQQEARCGRVGLGCRGAAPDDGQAHARLSDRLGEVMRSW
jgi:hypothetical protein